MGRCTPPVTETDSRLVMLFALSGTWIAVIVAVGVVVLIGLAVYSVWTLRKPENWERPHLKRHHSAEEAEREGLGSLSQAVALLEQKATPDEVEAYKRFTLDAAQRVAEAHKESGEAVSDDERAAIDRISTALGG